MKKIFKWPLKILLLVVFIFPTQLFASDQDYCSAVFSEENLGSEYKDLNSEPMKGFTGLGKLSISKKGCFYGRFSSGYPNGYGVIHWPDGTVYRGGFKGASAYGQGEFTHRFGWSFKGLWESSWPVNGVCSYKNNSEKCSVITSEEFRKEWDGAQRIRLYVLHRRYFFELDLLEASSSLRRGFMYQGKEIDLSRGMSVDKTNVLYRGLDFRDGARLGKAISFHSPYLELFIKHLSNSVNKDKQIHKFTINISPTGEAKVVTCSHKSIREICEEIARVDYGIINLKHNLELTFLIDGTKLALERMRRN